MATEFQCLKKIHSDLHHIEFDGNRVELVFKNSRMQRQEFIGTSFTYKMIEALEEKLGAKHQHRKMRKIKP